jgi:hypothetical protein
VVGGEADALTVRAGARVVKSGVDSPELRERGTRMDAAGGATVTYLIVTANGNRMAKQVLEVFR